MSAPNTNIDKQKERHKGPLTGLRLVVGVVAVLFVGLMIWLSASSDVEAPADGAAAVTTN